MIPPNRSRPRRDDDLWDEVWDNYDAARAARARAEAMPQVRARRRRGWLLLGVILLGAALMAAALATEVAARAG